MRLYTKNQFRKFIYCGYAMLFETKLVKSSDDLKKYINELKLYEQSKNKFFRILVDNENLILIKTNSIRNMVIIYLLDSIIARRVYGKYEAMFVWNKKTSKVFTFFRVRTLKKLSKEVRYKYRRNKKRVMEGVIKI